MKLQKYKKKNYQVKENPVLTVTDFPNFPVADKP